jgi:hypothetical protein
MTPTRATSNDRFVVDWVWERTLNRLTGGFVNNRQLS